MPKRKLVVAAILAASFCGLVYLSAVDTALADRPTPEITVALSSTDCSTLNMDVSWTHAPKSIKVQIVLHREDPFYSTGEIFDLPHPMTKGTVRMTKSVTGLANGQNWRWRVNMFDRNDNVIADTYLTTYGPESPCP